MNPQDEKIPSPRELEKEIGEFLAKKFGGEVRIISPVSMPQELIFEKGKQKKQKINFDLKPEELISYLDQYIIRQDRAKAILATKICTHFNRVKHELEKGGANADMVGRIKNNVLIIGPTGVGKTYMIKLIAKKIGIPFVKGDATKFSETGYVGGDVEDLVRDLVREADGDTELAKYGIIYLDEVDKIASSNNMIGADVSRTGVQRALLKPMEETEVELKVPHDPISMIQEIERFRQTGKRDRRTINTKNILFIMSGAFTELIPIIKRRLKSQKVGFSAKMTIVEDETDLLKRTTTEDLIEFGFESEFIGRLPVIAILDRLMEDDLFQILKNPNNPVILGKKLDFAAYGIDIKFKEDVLHDIAKQAYNENTGARGLVSAIERALLPFEKTLPSTKIKCFPVNSDALNNPEALLKKFKDVEDYNELRKKYEEISSEEIENIKEYLASQKKTLTERHNLSMTPDHIDTIASYYVKHVTDIGGAIERIKSYSDEIKKIEMYFYKTHDINIVMEEDAISFMIDQFINSHSDIKEFYRQLTKDFEFGLKLVREKTGKSRFFITKSALLSPEDFISRLIRDEYKA